MYDEIMAVYEGREGLPLVFQPRLRHWFDVNFNAGTLPDRYHGMYLDEVYRDLGVSPREVWGPRRMGSELSGYFALSNIEGDDIQVWTRRMRGYGGESEDDYLVTEIRTPVGSLRQVQRYTEHGTSLMNVEYYLKGLEDLKVFEHVLGERSYWWNQNRYEWGKKRYGKNIPLRANLERSPIMWLIVGLMGFKKTVTMIWRHPEAMKEFIRVLETEHVKQIDAYRGKPVAELSFGDNMHQDLCPPPYFRDYVIPFYQRVMPRVHAQGMVATSHWDGYVKQLLPLVGETGLDGLECVTPLPQGDVTLGEMKERMVGMFLRDGIPAVLMCPWTPMETLESHVRKLIEAFYPSLILGVSDLLPANGDLERVRLVNGIVEEFNEGL
ncbi:MAG: hypothetical protein JSV27_05310 [Candidatus Bathyarchaeota archaeon]|nr:MAG: hypothetical protein JSV27_05310 [Candidatus Bathyarchaeota archaeon]